MENDMNQKISMKELLDINRKSLKICYKENPEMFKFGLASMFVKAITPYVGIFITAQIIDELVGNREPKVVWFWVGAQLVISMIILLINALLNRYGAAYIQYDTYYRKIMDIYRKKKIRYGFLRSN